jgi:hypothetical protein
VNIAREAGSGRRLGEWAEGSAAAQAVVTGRRTTRRFTRQTACRGSALPPIGEARPHRGESQDEGPAQPRRQSPCEKRLPVVRLPVQSSKRDGAKEERPHQLDEGERRCRAGRLAMENRRPVRAMPAATQGSGTAFFPNRSGSIPRFERWDLTWIDRQSASSGFWRSERSCSRRLSSQ